MYLIISEDGYFVQCDELDKGIVDGVLNGIVDVVSYDNGKFYCLEPEKEVLGWAEISHLSEIRKVFE